MKHYEVRRLTNILSSQTDYEAERRVIKAILSGAQTPHLIHRESGLSEKDVRAVLKHLQNETIVFEANAALEVWDVQLKLILLSMLNRLDAVERRMKA